MVQNIITVKNLSYSFNSNINILENINFTINKKDLVAIVGPNGAGKSTLIKIIAGLIDIKNKNKHIQIKGKISYIPQNYNQDPNFPAKVKEILNLECCACTLREDVVRSLGIDGLENLQFKNLSGGQKQRVFIALSLLSNPDILILDEPTVGVDTKTLSEFYSLLKRLNQENDITILFVTHDTNMISNYFTKTLCVYNKGICIDDAKHTNILLNKTYGHQFHNLTDNKKGKTK
jgi:zinc transport system ATP-binding protein